MFKKFKYSKVETSMFKTLSYLPLIYDIEELQIYYNTLMNGSVLILLTYDAVVQGLIFKLLIKEITKCFKNYQVEYENTCLDFLSVQYHYIIYNINIIKTTLGLSFIYILMIIQVQHRKQIRQDCEHYVADLKPN